MSLARVLVTSATGLVLVLCHRQLLVAQQILYDPLVDSTEVSGGVRLRTGVGSVLGGLSGMSAVVNSFAIKFNYAGQQARQAPSWVLGTLALARQNWRSANQQDLALTPELRLIFQADGEQLPPMRARLQNNEVRTDNSGNRTSTLTYIAGIPATALARMARAKRVKGWLGETSFEVSRDGMADLQAMVLSLTPSPQSEAQIVTSGGGVPLPAEPPQASLPPAPISAPASAVPSPSPSKPAAGLKRTTAIGTPLGTHFEDSCARPAGVLLRAGAWLDAIQLLCPAEGGIAAMPLRGGTGGFERAFELEPGERITALSGTYIPGAHIYSIRIHTDRRVSDPYGTVGPYEGQQSFRLDVPSGQEFRGIHGTAGQYLGTLGLVVGTAALASTAPTPGAAPVAPVTAAAAAPPDKPTGFVLTPDLAVSDSFATERVAGTALEVRALRPVVSAPFPDTVRSHARIEATITVLRDTTGYRRAPDGTEQLVRWPYGLMFGGPDTLQRVQFLIDRFGTYSLRLANRVDAVPPAFSRLIQTGPNARNALAVELQGQVARLFINGAQVSQWTSARDLSGTIGFVTSTNQHLRFDSIRVHSLLPVERALTVLLANPAEAGTFRLVADTAFLRTEALSVTVFAAGQHALPSLARIEANAALQECRGNTASYGISFGARPDASGSQRYLSFLVSADGHASLQSLQPGHPPQNVVAPVRVRALRTVSGARNRLHVEVRGATVILGVNGAVVGRWTADADVTGTWGLTASAGCTTRFDDVRVLPVRPIRTAGN